MPTVYQALYFTYFVNILTLEPQDPPVLQMEKLKHREVKSLAQVCTARKWQCLNQNLGPQIPKICEVLLMTLTAIGD